MEYNDIIEIFNDNSSIIYDEAHIIDLVVYTDNRGESRTRVSFVYKGCSNRPEDIHSLDVETAMIRITKGE